jgi:hypothetical protein
MDAWCRVGRIVGWQLRTMQVSSSRLHLRQTRATTKTTVRGDH